MYMPTTTTTSPLTTLPLPLQMLSSIAGCIDVERVVGQYVQADYYYGVVQLCHSAAVARDPGRLGDNHYSTGQPLEDVEGRRFYDIRFTTPDLCR